MSKLISHLLVLYIIYLYSRHIYITLSFAISCRIVTRADGVANLQTAAMTPRHSSIFSVLRNKLSSFQQNKFRNSFTTKNILVYPSFLIMSWSEVEIFFKIFTRLLYRPHVTIVCGVRIWLPSNSDKSLVISLEHFTISTTSDTWNTKYLFLYNLILVISNPFGTVGENGWDPLKNHF